MGTAPHWLIHLAAGSCGDPSERSEMPAEPPSTPHTLDSRSPVDAGEGSGTAPPAPGDRRRHAAGAMAVALLLLVGIAVLVVLI
jgi:hypothetical protein